MKENIRARRIIAAVTAALVIGASARAQFAPLPITASSYTFDPIVESNYVNKASDTLVTVTMDSGPTTNTAGEFQNNTWFEMGLDLASNIVGLPHAGSLVTNQGEPDHVYQLAPSWTGNNVVFIGNYATNNQGAAPGFTSGHFTPSTAAAYKTLSFLTAAGNGPVLMNVDVYHADGSDDHSTMQSPDWFGAGPTNVNTSVTNGTAVLAFSALGRLSITGGFGNLGATNQCEIWSVDVPLANTTSPVTNIVLSWISGGRCCNFAVSGSTGSGFSPIALAAGSYNADAVVEAGQNYSIATLPYNATFDNGTNYLFNTNAAPATAGGNNAWFEQGYDPIGVTNGLPVHGSTFTSGGGSGAIYTMAPSYTTNDAILIDTNHQSANIVPQTPTAAAELSFLVSGGNVGSAAPFTALAIVQHADGINETNYIYYPDNFNDAASNAYSLNGRVNFSNGRQLNAFNGPAATGPGNNPKLFDSIMYLSDTTSPITNIALKYYNPGNANGTTWEGWLFAVSASPTALVPQTPTVSQTVLSTLAGTSATLAVPALGTTATYQWSQNGSAISGATGATYTTPTSLTPGLYSYSVAITTSAGTTNVPVELAVSGGSLFTNSSFGYWSINNDGGPFVTFPNINNNVLTLTDNHGYESASAWYNSPINVNGFVATFTFKVAPGNTGNNEADGFCFVLQNDPRGLSALGGDGNSRGVANISPSVELEFELYGPNGIGLAYEQNGAIPANNTSISNSAVNVASGHPITVGVYYNRNSGSPANSTATISEYDTVTGGTWSTNIVIGDLIQSLGNLTAYVGFTGGTGGAANTQTVSNFVFVPSVATPAPFVAALSPAVAATPTGTSVTFTAAATGGNATYQWSTNGTAVPGATLSTYSTPTNGALGVYNLSVAITTSAGTTNLPGAFAITANYAPLTDTPNWTVNYGGTTYTNTPHVATNLLQMTDNHGSQNVAAWYNFQEPINGFVASWIYQDNSGGTTAAGADGYSFALQNDSRGLKALGGGGGAIGISGVTPSQEWDFDLYPNNSPAGAPASGGSLNLGGMSYQINGGAATPYFPTGPVPIASGHAIKVGLYYNYAQGTILESLVDTATGASYTTNITVGDITANLGGPLAYVGFTAGTGGAQASQIVSNFLFQPLVAALGIVVPPTNVSVSVGQPASFSVGAQGGPPFTYQWQFNGTNITGATNATLSFASPQLTNAGTYTVVVTSLTLATTTNASAVLSVSPNIVATINPASINIYQGLSATFTATAYGSLPLSYQWFNGSTAIAGATNSTYSTPATLAVGSYPISVTVSNSTGALTPTAAALTIVAPSAFAQFTLNLNPVGFWPLNEQNGTVAYDYVGGDNGTYVGEPSVSTGYPGPTPPGFGTNTDFSAYFDGTSGWVDVPLKNLNFTNSMTMFAWIQPAQGTSKFQTFFGHSDSSYRMDYDSTSAADPAHFANNPAGDATGGPNLGDGAWHMVAGVYDTNTGNRTLYVDGLFAAVANSASHPAGSALDVIIGGDPQYLPPTANRLFVGYIADAALFNYALTSNQIEQIYVASGIPALAIVSTNAFFGDAGGSATLTATTNGTPQLTLQWYSISPSFVIAPVAGQTNATLTLNNLSGALNQYEYFLVATNAYGSSSNAAFQNPATLTVYSGAPQILTDIAPLNAFVTNNQTANFSVLAVGSAPLSYQWYANGSAVTGATNSSFSFTATSPTNTVYVKVSNSSGSAQSSTATIVELGNSLFFLGSGSGWTINKSGTFSTGATIANNAYIGTDGGGSEATTAFYNTKEPINGFTATWTYTATGSGTLADGEVFVLQNDSRGAAAIGGGGGNLAINSTTITPSIDFEINLYPNNTVGIAYDVNGAIGPNSATPIAPAGGPWPSDPIQITVNYNQSAGQIAWTLLDTVSGVTYTTNINSGDITTILGGTNAYIGFASATGGSAAAQTVSGFVYTPTGGVAPPPPKPTIGINSPSSGVFVFTWTPPSSPTYRLQQAPTVVGPWTSVTNAPVIVNGNDTITVTNTASAQFYRLISP
jgi:hypothetical protein